MNAPDRIPHIPGPPYEPTSLLLNGHVGWHIDNSAWNGSVGADHGSLILAEDELSARQFGEASGSLGGMVPPSTVAIGPDGAVYLLDSGGSRLRRFDPCKCLFAELEGIGRVGGGAREWRNPNGIAIGCGKLYVCDTGIEETTILECEDATATQARLQRENHRVSVFSLNGLALYGHLRPNGDAWHPIGVAVNAAGYAYVTDSLNGMVHVFSPMLRFVRSLTGYANPGAIAVDKRGYLYVVCDGQNAQRVLRVLNDELQEIPPSKTIAEFRPHFSSLPFKVDGKGNLYMSALCIGMDGNVQAGISQSCVFDLHGESVLPAPGLPQSAFVGKGDVTIGALDSKTQRCVWHRVIVRGDLPQGSQLKVETFTSDQFIPLDQLSDFAVWQTGQTAHQFVAGQWDCLVRSEAGRYLWLRLGMSGNGKVTPRICNIEIEFPRIGSMQYLPAVYSAEPTSADFTARLLALFDTTLRSIERQVDDLPRLFDPHSVPSTRVKDAPIDFLSWLATWVGASLDRNWDEQKRRQFLKRAGWLFDRRGTLEGLRESLKLLLGLDRGLGCACPDEPIMRCGCRPSNCAPKQTPVSKWKMPPLVLEHFKVRRWLFVGKGRLGERSVLWGQRIINRSQLDVSARADRTQLIGRPDPLHDPFLSHAHQFTVFLPSWVRKHDTQRKALQNLLASESPAHVKYYIEYVEPRFRIGVQSTLGFDAVIAAPPAELVLGDKILGQAVVGTPTRERIAGQKLEVGTRSRVGTTTKVN